MTSPYMKAYHDIFSDRKKRITENATVHTITDIDDILYLLRTQSPYLTTNQTFCCSYCDKKNIRLVTSYTEDGVESHVEHFLGISCYGKFLFQKNERMAVKRHNEIVRLLTLIIVRDDKDELEKLVIHKL
ncbi:MAG: hypothetical protein Edafosvirus17_20 [Edafosvirus sp.]|uniref:Uncharacterized protein n=1 Tax=Edafosvirus sp. TaxID=2487765 RepID=A0A3G4ZW11_9VIRU|nr:MAG: hypothetical protein Edafosvirus17_20 [Edafosvirus sp.]